MAFDLNLEHRVDFWLLEVRISEDRRKVAVTLAAVIFVFSCHSSGTSEKKGNWHLLCPGLTHFLCIGVYSPRLNR